jgi:hypothetical protein
MYATYAGHPLGQGLAKDQVLAICTFKDGSLYVLEVSSDWCTAVPSQDLGTYICHDCQELEVV